MKTENVPDPGVVSILRAQKPAWPGPLETRR